MKELFNKMYDGSFYTICGAGGRTEDWIDGYNDLLKEAGIGKPKKWYEFYGKDMNEVYNLTGNNRYPANFHFLSFEIDGLDISKLAIFKLKMRDRWFDDIVDNNLRREGVN